jgi:hypothetical protein
MFIIKLVTNTFLSELVSTNHLFNTDTFYYFEWKYENFQHSPHNRDYFLWAFINLTLISGLFEEILNI